MLTFDIEPYVGALPISFGMDRAKVHTLLGTTRVAGKWDAKDPGSASDSFGKLLEINVGYDNDRRVDHVGFSPGDFFALSLLGSAIWTPSEHPDPNPVLLRFDPAPLERLGFLVFTRLGVTTTGYHDDDKAQYALTVFPRGEWDRYLVKATRPDLSRYLPGNASGSEQRPWNQ
jgi:hypothetical protein